MDINLLDIYYAVLSRSMFLQGKGRKQDWAEGELIVLLHIDLWNSDGPPELS